LGTSGGTQTHAVNGKMSVTLQLIGGGTTTNDDAAAGKIGEVARSYQGSLQTIASSATYINVTSISLTAGDWVVDGIVQFSANGATMTTVNAAISTNSANTTTDHVEGDNWINSTNLPNASADSAVTISGYRISVSSTTTVYLKASSNFSAGNPKALGRISARRPR
jgi:hypothetical protein